MSVWIEIGINNFVPDFFRLNIKTRNHGKEICLSGKKERVIKAFLYSKFSGDKELLLKQDGFEDERLNLNDIFNEK